MKARVLVALLALACVASCNQADPADSTEPSRPKDAGSNDDGGTGAPTSGPDYFPLRDGASWKYLHSNGGWTETVTLEAQAAGRFLLTTSPDSDGLSEQQTLVRTGGEVLRVTQDGFDNGALDHSVTYDPGFLRFSAAWADDAPGFSERRMYVRTETKAGASTAKASEERAHIYTVEALSEEVTVPAGTFRGCLRVRRERDYDTAAPDGGTLPEEQEKRYWFCPGVGKVREQSIVYDTYEYLQEYDLPEP